MGKRVRTSDPVFIEGACFNIAVASYPKATLAVIAGR
jgi:hypothetical protein